MWVNQHTVDRDGQAFGKSVPIGTLKSRDLSERIDLEELLWLCSTLGDFDDLQVEVIGFGHSANGSGAGVVLSWSQHGRTLIKPGITHLPGVELSERHGCACSRRTLFVLTSMVCRTLEKLEVKSHKFVWARREAWVPIGGTAELEAALLASTLLTEHLENIASAKLMDSVYGCQGLIQSSITPRSTKMLRTPAFWFNSRPCQSC